jgi:rSAM/selenodomain-associated transferase 1
MAKAPVPGRVKTRLCPPLTPEECAEINACFLRDTVENLRLASLESPARLVISYTPVGEERAFSGILPEGTLLVPQRGDGFGERLLFTAQDLFACGFAAVCLIDSDSPTVPTSEFERAALALTGGHEHLTSDDGRIVLGCSEDGGYYLIGMRAPHPEIFERITWSTASVAAETLERAEQAGLTCTLLETWYDVDDAASLDALREEFAGQSKHGYAAPHSRAYLAACAAELDTRVAGARP